MFHRTFTASTPIHPRDPTQPLRLHIEQRAPALRHAAELLAGSRGVRLVDDLVDRLAQGRGQPLDRVARRKIGDLIDILALEHVHDPKREEAARFARIDPSDPVVEEICLLLDELRAAIAQGERDQPPAFRLQPAA